MPLAFTRDADILAMFADSPHTITGWEVTAPCLFDDYDEQAEVGRPGGGGQVARTPKATVQTSVFPEIKNGDPVTINGAGAAYFKVWNHVRVGDGALTELYLRPV